MNIACLLRIEQKCRYLHRAVGLLEVHVDRWSMIIGCAKCQNVRKPLNSEVREGFQGNKEKCQLGFISLDVFSRSPVIFLVTPVKGKIVEVNSMFA